MQRERAHDPSPAQVAADLVVDAGVAPVARVIDAGAVEEASEDAIVDAGEAPHPNEQRRPRRDPRPRPDILPITHD